MLDWLLDNAVVIGLLLGVLIIGLGIAFWVTRKRYWLFGVGGVLVLLIIVALLKLFVPTDQSRIKNSIEAMRSAVQKQDTDGVMKHIAKDFSFQGLDRTAFRLAVDTAFKRRLVNDVNVWEFDEIKIDRPNKTASLAFKAKPSPQNTSAEGLEHYLIRATFVLEGEDEWKMKTFQVFNPFVDTDKPIQVQLP
jgi:hypothetical protein